ncbi:ATP-binding cassette, subfamily B [Clostridium acidisoli DSM 12555]|uniref:ATP-binding cassette, subfamily B n=1 Tax=Clostridium acidisoli DSM 12555 TaxID=1121291 RepID=A0A1W1XUG9_9CLOT|nr:ABC transporter ATP-binding protein [Clostridium acidisoli]SMC27181.1 ATP-binding cassette, subfamily B [Clostridium acidisoli DSM 12555]
MLEIKSKINNIKRINGFILKTIKIIWNSSRLSFIATLLITFINGVILPINMIISKYLIDSVISTLSNKNMPKYRNEVFMWLFIEFSVTILSYLINRINTYFSDIQIKALNNHIAQLLIRKANELDLSYFENNDFYNKIEKANNQSAYSTMAIVNSLNEIVKNFSTLIGSIVIVIQLNPLMLMLCMLTSIPMFFINIKFSKMKYDIYSNRIEKTRFAEYLQKIMLNYNSIKEIKLNRLGLYFEKLILSTYRKNLDKDKAVGKKQLMSLSVTDLLSTIISYIYKFYVIFVTLSRGLTIGSMNMYISALTNVDSSIKNTLSNVSELYSNNLYIENLFYILDLQPIINDSPNPVLFKSIINDCIEFKNISFKYPKSNKYVLKNISFKIKANQTCAVVGLNGCGKTTLIKLLTRLYDPTEGEILIDGVNIKDYSLASLYKYVNVVFQDFMKYPFTVRENIGFGDIENVNNINSIEAAARKSNAYDFIQNLDKKFDTKLEKLWSNGVELSLGQWQKLAISRAFMSDSAILILDEPTASVDAQSEYEIFNNFKELVGNRTSILISHRFSTVKMADLIIVLEDGKLVENGTHHSLILKKGLYYKLYTMQAEAYLDDTAEETESLIKNVN